LTEQEKAKVKEDIDKLRDTDNEAWGRLESWLSSVTVPNNEYQGTSNFPEGWVNDREFLARLDRNMIFQIALDSIFD
jgi:hypothetical protein